MLAIHAAVRERRSARPDVLTWMPRSRIFGGND
jgi:hypothetical protein